MMPYIREGDGDRVMTYWKFFLPIFRILGQKKYSIEAVDIQLLHHHHLIVTVSRISVVTICQHPRKAGKEYSL